MENKQTPSTSLVILQQQWRAFALMAVAIARKLVRAERAGAGEAWAAAGQLELWVRAALVQVMSQIAEAAERGEPDCEEAQDALVQLRSVACSLLTLAVFLRSLAAQLAARGVRRFARTPIYASPGLPLAMQGGAGRLPQRPAYLDSS